MVEQSEYPELEAIRSSGLFDPSYYLAMNPDIRPEPVDPVLHYCECGWREGRNPSSDFDTRHYLETYSDIKTAKMNPFWHYIIAGRFEGREALPGRMIRYEDDIQFGDLKNDLRLIAYFFSDGSGNAKVSAPPSDTPALTLNPSASDCLSYTSGPAILSNHAVLARRHGITAFCFSVSPHEPESWDSLSTIISNLQIDIEFLVDLDLRTVNLNEKQMQLLQTALRDARYLRVSESPVVVLTLPTEDRSCAEAVSTFEQRITCDHKLFRISRRDVRHADVGSASRFSFDAELDFPVNPVPGETGPYKPVERNGFSDVPYGVVVSHALTRINAYDEDASRCFRAITVGRNEAPAEPVSPLRYTNYSNKEYHRWLDAAMTEVHARFKSGHRLLFLNAWNDWKRGAVLLPDQQHGFSKLNETTRTLLEMPTGLILPKVSVIVPNYNHADYLVRRLESIYRQTYKNIEVLLLDDFSTDESRDILTEFAGRHREITKTLFNQENSGGVFRQWARGLEAATGDLIWIAESDDYCDENFLDTLVRCFEDEAVMLAYSRVEFVEADETVMPNVFQHYVRTLDCLGKWEQSYVNTAHKEVSEALGIINTIPNASGAVFRRPVNMPLLKDDEWLTMKVAGDWIFYLHLIRGAKLAYSTETTNYFRRGAGSVAAKGVSTDSFYRELGIAIRTVCRLYDVSEHVIDSALERALELYRNYRSNEITTFSVLYNKSAALKERESRTPNVLVTTMGFYPGGAEILPIRIANELKRQGHSVLLLSTGLLGTEDGVRRLLRPDVPLVETANLAFTRQIIEDFGIEVLNSHQWHIQKYPVAMRDVFASLKGHVASLHGMIEHGNAFGTTAKQLQTANKFVSTWVYTADKNLGPFIEHKLYQANPSRFVKLPNGMEPPIVNPIRRADIGIPDNAFVLCCVSRAIADKGWAEAIEAVARAREATHRDIRLILVGNGPVYDTYCKSGVPPFVYLAGFSANAVGFYASADMGIMLTKFKSESFPLTIVDCLFAGRPFIATGVGEIRNMLTTESGLAGEVIDLDDWEVPIDKAASLIAKFATDADAINSCQGAVPIAANRYTIESVVKQYLVVFKQTKTPSKGTMISRLMRWFSSRWRTMRLRISGI